MDTMRLFNEWHAYMSSALTISDAKERDRIKYVNEIVADALKKTGTFVYLPQLYSDPSRGDKMRPEEIYILDRWRIAESDFVIMNLDLPSFGVGQEAEIACAAGIPIIAFHYAGSQVSRIIRGVPALFSGDAADRPSEQVVVYSDQIGYSDLLDRLVAAVQRVQGKLRTQREFPLPRFSELLAAVMRSRGWTVEDLAREAGFTEPFVGSLLQDYKSVENMLAPYGILEAKGLRKIHDNKFLNPGLWVLQRLASALGVSLSALIGEPQTERIWHEPLIAASRAGVSLEEFVAVANDADYVVLFKKVAMAESDKKAMDEVSDNIINLAERRRSRGDCRDGEN